MRSFRSPALQWLATVAQGWAEQPALWGPLVRHDADGRWVAPLAAVSMTFYGFRRGHGLIAVREELSDQPIVASLTAT